MEKKDYTNSAIVFVESGIFAKEGVENLQAQKKPILKVKANVDGRDVEIGLYFKMVYDEATKGYTNEYYYTKNGSKMLTGKVEDPYVPNNQIDNSFDKPTGDIGRDEFEDEVPF